MEKGGDSEVEEIVQQVAAERVRESWSWQLKGTGIGRFGLAGVCSA